MSDDGWRARVLRLAALVQFSDEAIIGCDLDGQVVCWNRGAEELMCCSEAEALGRPLSALFAPDRAHEAEEMVVRLWRGEGVRGHETIWLTGKGLPLEVSLSMSTIQEERVPVGVAIAVRDIGEQRWLASALDQTVARLEEALAEARESEACSRRFLADAAHQLRSPISGMRVCIQTLLLGVDTEEAHTLLADAVRETSRAAGLIDSMLRMARLDQGEPVTTAPVDPVALCADEVDRAWSLSPQLDMTVSAHPMPGLPPELDERLVREILSNLLDNARRHAAQRVRAVIGKEGPYVEIRVVDDGPGLSPPLAERVFERFVSLDGMGGSGLGLPIARELARAHGGDLRYEGRERGFVLRLPSGDGGVPVS